MPNDQSSDGDAANDSREMGVDFGPLHEKLASLDYPIEREALLAEYGDYELETAGGSETLQSILGGQEMEEEGYTYDSADEVHQAVLNMIGAEAVGREHYSDRGGTGQEETEEGEDTTDESL